MGGVNAGARSRGDDDLCAEYNPVFLCRHVVPPTLRPKFEGLIEQLAATRINGVKVSCPVTD